jgi:hypothetical protein
MSFVRNNLWAIALGAVALSVALMAFACTRGDGEQAEPQVEMQHECELSELALSPPRFMTATGTVRNLLRVDQTVTLEWFAESTRPGDASIVRAYPVNLEPLETVTFEHHIISPASVTDRINVNDHYQCRVVITR